MRRRLQQLRPEVLVAVPFVLIFLAGLGLGLPPNLPDGRSLGFIEQHYFRPLLVAVALQALVLFVRGRSKGRRVEWPTLAWLLALLTITVPLHFNFKAWSPLVHSRLFDGELQTTDSAFGDLVPWLIVLRRGVADAAGSLGFNVDGLYHQAFVAMFFVAFIAHALADTTAGLRKVVLAACLVLLIGGVAYWCMPAKGPFLFRFPENRLAHRAQSAMTEMFDTLIRTRRVPPGYFAAPLAAMPSLHTAHAVTFCLFAQRRLRWLCWLFYPMLAWILVEAVATGWHYVLDLVAGWALALLCVYLAERLVPEAASANAH